MASLIKVVRVTKMTDKAGSSERSEEKDLSRLEALYHRYAGRIFTLCMRLLTDMRAAEEATATVFVRFSHELSRRLSESSILSRLRELAIDEAIECLKAHGSRRESSITAKAPARSGGEAPPPLNPTMLDALVAQLPHRLRIAFVLRDREGLSDKAIASYLRIDRAEARRLVQQARLEMRRLWRAQG